MLYEQILKIQIFVNKYFANINKRDAQMEYKKKLTDIFLRKQEKTKKQTIPQKPKIKQFDQSYFEAQLVYDNVHTTLIKVTAVIKKGPNQGEQIPLNCKWYVKNQYDFKQIEDVKASCFQPCLQDVGNKICVQIEPCVEGMTYTGITIMKQSDQLKLDKKLQNLSNEYFMSKHLEMQGKIQAMYSQNPIYQKYEYPSQVIIVLRDRKVSFKEKHTKQIISEYTIEEDFPHIDFIRKSFNSVIFSCDHNQSMKLSLSNNFNRDLFSLIIKSIPSKLSVASEEQLQKVEPQSTFLVKSKSQVEGVLQQKTKLILRLDEQNKQIKNLKRNNEQLTTNYHLERNAKINLQNQIEKLKSLLAKTNEQHKQCKPVHLKNKQVLEQNKFYFGQISLLKSEIKQKNHRIKQLNAQADALKTQKQSSQGLVRELIDGPKLKIQFLEKQLSKSKMLSEQVETQNENLRQKINQLQNEGNVLKKKVSSIVSQKSLPTSPVKSPSKISSLQDISPAKDGQIRDLKMQIANLMMLLKHKSGEKGGQMISLHQLVNNLTQKIGEKQLQVETLKRINKQLCKKMH